MKNISWEVIEDEAMEQAYEIMAGEEGCLDYNQRFEELVENICINKFEEVKRKQYYKVGYDCLLDDMFVYDMQKAHEEPKTLREKWKMFEPDVFDMDVSEEQYRAWRYE